MVALGIDLGTTNCRMAVWRNNKVEILENDLGKRTTLSVEGFLKGKNVRKITDYMVNKMYTPEEKSAMVLKYMKDCAEKRFDTKIVEAVITVPTYFNQSQRQAIKTAATLAGFTSIRLLNEPIAAAIQYGIENNISDGRTLLVFQLSSRAFYVSVVKYGNHEFEELVADGDYNLGGEDIDQSLMDFIIRENNLDRKTKRLIARVKHCAEVAKIDLSTKHHADIEIVSAPHEIQMSISRSTFNELIKNIIDKTMSIVENCLTTKKMLNIKIDDVLLLGASTKIPKIREVLCNRFGKPSKYNENAEETVVAGAAIWAARLYDGVLQDLKILSTCPCLLEEDIQEMISKISFKNIALYNSTKEWLGILENDSETFNICPFSLWVENGVGKMSKLIHKNSVIPISATKKYKFTDNDQMTVNIKIYSGESESDKNENTTELCIPSEAETDKASNIHLDHSDDVAVLRKCKDDVKELISNVAATNFALYSSTKKWLEKIENVKQNTTQMKQTLMELWKGEQKFEELSKLILK